MNNLLQVIYKLRLLRFDKKVAMFAGHDIQHLHSLFIQKPIICTFAATL